MAINRHSLWPGAESLLVTLWVGSVWAVGFIAAPILFNELDDRTLAGTLAGHMFTAVAWLGLVAGTVLLLGNLVLQKSRGYRSNLVVLGMLVLVLIGQFVLQPTIAELRATGILAGSSEAKEFARIHAIASLLYLLTSLLGVLLVLFRPSSGKV